MNNIKVQGKERNIHRKKGWLLNTNHKGILVTHKGREDFSREEHEEDALHFPLQFGRNKSNSSDTTLFLHLVRLK